MFWLKILYPFLISPMHATCPGHTIPLHSIIITMPKNTPISWTFLHFWHQSMNQGKHTVVLETCCSSWQTLASGSHFCERSRRKTNDAFVGQLVSLITQVPEVDSLETSDIDMYQHGWWSENTQLHLVAMKTSYLNTNLYVNYKIIELELESATRTREKKRGIFTEYY
jgi:hypothetical protein